jgi:hypothetical protein
MYSPFLNSLVGQITEPIGSAVGQLGTAFGEIGNVGLGFVSPGSGPGFSSSFGGGYTSGLSQSLNLSPGVLSALGMSAAGIPSGSASYGLVGSSGAQGVLASLPQAFPGAPPVNGPGGNSQSPGSTYLGSGSSSFLGMSGPEILVLVIAIGAVAFAIFGRGGE